MCTSGNRKRIVQDRRHVEAQTTPQVKTFTETGALEFKGRKDLYG
jgi:hypothetical protein